MKVAFFSARKYEEKIFQEAQKDSEIEFDFLEARLTEKTAQLASGYQGICVFVNDVLNEAVLTELHKLGVRFIALRCAGFNNVHLPTARKLGLRVVRVPEYSPYAVAEHAVALLLTLNRKIHKAHYHVREMNFSLEGLVGFDLHGKTVGIIGTGKIGHVFAKIMNGFGCSILVRDIKTDPEIAAIAKYVTLDELLEKSDIISLHCPLNDATKHLINESAFAKMKSNAILINTGRGGLIDTQALIKALKAHRIGGACLDVYEEEEGVFFTDQSSEGITDDILARLTTFPNVIMTSHQAFLTQEALMNIADTTKKNFVCLIHGTRCENEVAHMS
ncbi:2-hydroxyacid dehydrogenase [Bdellovibrio sp. KM01]|uniref:2-hydroxyacid dehydrogenase n=1 Tax=Bdellovibrio sp. KM01 TaxID=2748865 RepID=UPI0015E9AC5F|nr:2-hydroxyacid dehydrogenase [Bdellovibrio sp. KM01]QLY25233.1 2-hydroxyacid dehydrogenase [Bdellovibrio sp. KM01]